MKRVSRGWRGVAAGLIAASALVSATARAAAPDPEAGHALARRWCVSCHQVDADDAANGVASSFQMLAKKNRHETAWTRSWVREPHPRIQGVVFTKYQIDAVVAYLKSITPE